MCFVEATAKVATTCCSASSILPGHAPLVTVGCEAPGTKYPPLTEGHPLVRDDDDCQHQGGRGARMG